jgi:hypothetical protein
MEEPQKGKRLVRIMRVIEGLPVFSSSATFGFTRDKNIGFMEFHWPEIPERVVTEAHRLKFKVQNGWSPPPQKGAKIESIEAGILHSSALGFLLDIYPSIRVIYSSEGKKMGRKLTLYFDRHGMPIPYPREFEHPCPEFKKPRGK